MACKPEASAHAEDKTTTGMGSLLRHCGRSAGDQHRQLYSLLPVDFSIDKSLQSESKGLFWADDNLIFKICVPSRAQPSVLEKREDDVIWLEVSHKSSFSTEGHLAVIAGVNASGEKEYIARVRGTDDKPRGFCCTVTEGATSVRYVDQSGQVRTSTCFEVAVLRYDPYFSEKTPRPPTGSDGTGHLHWRKLSARERMTYDMQIPVWSSMR